MIRATNAIVHSLLPSRARLDTGFCKSVSHADARDVLCYQRFLCNFVANKSRENCRFAIAIKKPPAKTFSAIITARQRVRPRAPHRRRLFRLWKGTAIVLVISGIVSVSGRPVAGAEAVAI